MPSAPANTDSVPAFCGLRQIQHRARLDEAPTEVPLGVVAQERAAGLALCGGGVGGGVGGGLEGQGGLNAFTGLFIVVVAQ